MNNNITKIKEAGMYLINLDIIVNDLSKTDEAIKKYYVTSSQEINCISQLRENIFICSSKLIPENKADYALITFKIVETDEGPDIKRICYKYGIFKNIVTSEIINDSFIVCSDNADNQVLKIDDEGKIYNCFNMVLNTNY